VCRDDRDAIASDVEGKTPAEVKAYMKVFFARYKELAGKHFFPHPHARSPGALTDVGRCGTDWEKIMGTIERGEARLKRREEIAGHLRWKVESSPRGDMRFNYGQGNKVKVYTEDEDRFLVRPRARDPGISACACVFVCMSDGGHCAGDDAAPARLRGGRRVRPHAARDPRGGAVPL
jgi:hypothetical protein